MRDQSGFRGRVLRWWCRATHRDQASSGRLSRWSPGPGVRSRGLRRTDALKTRACGRHDWGSCHRLHDPDRGRSHRAGSGPWGRGCWSAGFGTRRCGHRSGWCGASACSREPLHGFQICSGGCRRGWASHRSRGRGRRRRDHWRICWRVCRLWRRLRLRLNILHINIRRNRWCFRAVDLDRVARCTGNPRIGRGRARRIGGVPIRIDRGFAAARTRNLAGCRSWRSTCQRISGNRVVLFCSCDSLRCLGATAAGLGAVGRICITENEPECEGPKQHACTHLDHHRVDLFASLMVGRRRHVACLTGEQVFPVAPLCRVLESFA